jgi:uncharacterized metal-binding protein
VGRALCKTSARPSQHTLLMNHPHSGEPPGAPVCVLACSGCSAAGELADHTARRLQRLGAAKMSCLAGVGGRIPSITAAVRNASGILMIDGCPLECGANVLRNAGFANFKQLKLHELSVRKNDAGAVDETSVARLAEAALRVLNEPPETSPA